MTTDSEQYLKVAEKAARAGGLVLMEHYGKLQAGDVSLKGEADWVTRIDRLSEEVVIGVIQEAFPDHTIRAEESSPQAKISPLHWFVDPLDGTSNYIHQFPVFTVSIALMKEGKLEAGAVFDPVREELFTARRGQGATLNGRRIQVAQRKKLTECLLTTGFPARAKAHLDLYLESFRRIFLKTGLIRRAGSAALDLVYTACGRCDGFWEMSLSAWDMAAGALIIEEAGGRVSDFLGGDAYLSNGHITAGNPAIHAELLEILTPLFQGKI